MADLTDDYSLSEDFGACGRDLNEAQDFIDAYNKGEAYFSGINSDYLFYEHEHDGVLMVPKGDIVRLYSENPDAFEKLFEDQSGLQSNLNEALKDLPYCGPALLGQAAKPPTAFS